MEKCLKIEWNSYTHLHIGNVNEIFIVSEIVIEIWKKEIKKNRKKREESLPLTSTYKSFGVLNAQDPNGIYMRKMAFCYYYYLKWNALQPRTVHPNLIHSIILFTIKCVHVLVEIVGWIIIS